MKAVRYKIRTDRVRKEELGWARKTRDYRHGGLTLGLVSAFMRHWNTNNASLENSSFPAFGGILSSCSTKSVSSSLDLSSNLTLRWICGFDSARKSVTIFPVSHMHLLLMFESLEQE